MEEIKTWADDIAKQITTNRKKSKYICHGMWTPSGFFHLGNSRPEIFTPYSVFHAIEELGHKAEQHLIVDDFDAVDNVPENLGIKEEDKESFIGYPCAIAPSPIAGYKNWADAFVSDIEEVIEDYGVKPQIISAYESYRKGLFDSLILEALEKAEAITKVWNDIAGTKKKKFLPVKVLCEQCNKIHFTNATSWDGKFVGYKCSACGYEGKVKPKKGQVKLHWRVHWVAHWKLYDVDFESGGKDHFSKGGSVDVGRAIAKQVFNFEPPYQIPTEFIQLGKEKMSGSKGNLFTLKDWINVASPESFRYLNFSRNPNSVIELNLRDNSFLLVMEEFERAERIYYGKEHTQSEKLDKKIARSYELSLLGKPKKEMPQRLSYSFAILLSQLFDSEKHIADIEELMLNTAHIERRLSNEERKEVQMQLKRAKNWVERYAPDHYKIKFLEDASAAKQAVPAEVKEIFKEIADMIDKAKNAEELQNKIYQTTKAKGLQPKEVFQLLYSVLIGKQFGPKIGTLIFALGKEKVKKRLLEI